MHSETLYIVQHRYMIKDFTVQYLQIGRTKMNFMKISNFGLEESCSEHKTR